MNNYDFKENIKVPDKLDEYVLKGIEKGRSEKTFIKKDRNLGAVTKAAGLLLAGTIGIGVINPDIIRAMPIISSVLEGFESSNFGMPTDKFVKYSHGITLVSENKNATITLNEVLIDENIAMFGLTVESDVLKGFDGKNPSDFINLDARIKLNGQYVENYSHKARKIDDNIGAVVLTANIAELEIDDNVKVELNVDHIQGEKQLSGKWDFKLETSKVEGSKRIQLGQSYDIKGQKLVIDEIVTSPLATTILFSGVDSVENEVLFGAKYKAIDDRGNTIRANIESMHMDTKSGNVSGKLVINSDLSDTKYIELVPYWGSDLIDKKIEGIYVDLLTTTGNGDREEMLVTREPSKEELKNGYALSKVYYNLNMDKAKEFLSIGELIGYEIPVNNKDKVIIQNIEVNDENTKVTMKVVGDYNKDYLSELVIFDENLKDTSIWEGHIGAVIEDEKENIYSITLDKIDTSKKYKIAIPMTKDIDFTSEYKIKIDIN